MSDSITRTTPLAVLGLLLITQIGAQTTASPIVLPAGAGVVSTVVTTPNDQGTDQTGPQDGLDGGGVDTGPEPAEAPDSN